jgi:hypothetical protein
MRDRSRGHASNVVATADELTVIELGIVELDCDPSIVERDGRPSEPNQGPTRGAAQNARAPIAQQPGNGWLSISADRDQTDCACPSGRSAPVVVRPCANASGSG